MCIHGNKSDLAVVNAIIVTILHVGVRLADLIPRQGARLDEPDRDIKKLIADVAAQRHRGSVLPAPRG